MTPMSGRGPLLQCCHTPASTQDAIRGVYAYSRHCHTIRTAQQRHLDLLQEGASFARQTLTSDDRPTQVVRSLALLLCVQHMKHGSNTADVQTTVGASINDNLRLLFGPKLAREILQLSIEDSNLSFSAQAFVSNPNYNMKKATFILFINRMLEHARNRMCERARSDTNITAPRGSSRSIGRIDQCQESDRQRLHSVLAQKHASIRVPEPGIAARQGRRQRASDQERSTLSRRGSSDRTSTTSYRRAPAVVLTLSHLLYTAGLDGRSFNDTYVEHHIDHDDDDDELQHQCQL